MIEWKEKIIGDSMSSAVLKFANNVDHTPPAKEASYRSQDSGKSLSEERAEKAAVWVEKEVYKLLEEIEKIGQVSSNEVTITFGELFTRYQDVSDTLVGILQRAKKRDLIKYEGKGGHLLLQGHHDHVVITMDRAKANKWKQDYKNGTISSSASSPASNANNTPSPAAAAAPAKLTVKEQYELEKQRKSMEKPKQPKETNRAPPPPPPSASSGGAIAVENNNKKEEEPGMLKGLINKILSPVGSEENLVKKAAKEEGQAEDDSYYGKTTKALASLNLFTTEKSPPAKPASSSTTTNTNNNSSGLGGALSSLYASLSGATTTSAPPPLKLSTSSAPKPAENSSSATSPRPHLAAFPQRTGGGVKGAVVHHHSTPAAKYSPHEGKKNLSPAAQEWAKKQAQRPVVTSSNRIGSGGVAAKTQAFSKMNSEVKAASSFKGPSGAGGNVSSKLAAFEKR